MSTLHKITLEYRPIVIIVLIVPIFHGNDDNVYNSVIQVSQCVNN